MRRICLSIAVLALIAAAYGLGRYHSPSAVGHAKGRRLLYYVDPMHPAYKSDHPGIAPDCGMQLEPVFDDDKNGQPQMMLTQSPAGSVRVDSATRKLLGIQTATVEPAVATRTLRVVGRVIPEDTRVYRLNPGVDGFIRETFDDSVGSFVKQGQRLATYYAPDFLSVASGFLAAVQGVPGAVGKDGAKTVPFPGAVAKQGVSSLQGYMDRLRNLGMSDQQIQHVAESRQLPESIDVVSPVDGFILARNISAGQHFEHTMDFYRIADLSHVWVVAEVYEQDVPHLGASNPAYIGLRGAGVRLPARIANSLPQSEPGGGTVKYRLEVNNPTFALRPDMLVDVDLPVHLPQGITVPLDALVESGAHARVYVERGEGVYEPRAVATGWRNGEWVEIKHGLQPGERVVVAATFLIDSESRLKSPEAIAALERTTQRTSPHPQAVQAASTVKDPSCGMAVDPAKALSNGNTLAYHGTTYYFCSKQCKEAFQNDPTGSANRRVGGDDD